MTHAYQEPAQRSQFGPGYTTLQQDDSYPVKQQEFAELEQGSDYANLEQDYADQEQDYANQEQGNYADMEQ